MRCNCLKPSKADEEVTLTPRVIPKASASQANQPPATKSSVPQQDVVGVSKATKISASPAAGVIQVGGGVEAINPSISGADTVPESETSLQPLADPLDTGTPDKLSDTDNGSSTSSQSATGTTTSLWETAYNELRKTDSSLIDDLEAVIKADASLSEKTDLKAQIDGVVKIQKNRMESKQWQFSWFNETVKTREVIENIFSMLTNCSGAISTGMTFTPIYVSIPWSAVAALLPLIMSDITKHREALQGLERVTKIMCCYVAVEKKLLENPKTRKSYSDVFLPLYIELLKYKCTAARYFGKNTFKRMVTNAMGSTAWSDTSAQIVDKDDECRRHITLSTAGEILHNQRSDLNQLLEAISSLRIEKPAILEWMSTAPFGEDHDGVRNLLGKAYQSSGKWIFKHPKFQEWQQSSSGVFWLRGTAGTGKSSLTSIVIQELLDRPTGYLAYFYCSQARLEEEIRKDNVTKKQKKKKNAIKITAGDETRVIFRALAKALSVYGHPTFKTFSEEYKKVRTEREAGQKLQLETCMSLLSRSIDENPSKSVTLVIDAIDECVYSNELLQNLQKIRGLEGSVRKIRIFISSRDGPNVDMYFPDVLEAKMAANNREDIETYLDNEIPLRRRHDGKTAMTDSQALELHKILVECSSGMFQWVVLQIEIFLSQEEGAQLVVPKTIDDKIQNLKKSKLEPIAMLTQAYDQIYKVAVGKNDHYRPILLNSALQWLLCSCRDLKIGELLVVAAVQRDGVKLEGVQESRLKDTLRNFIIEAPSGEVRFAHSTIRPYLENKTDDDKHFIFEASSANLTAALTCLRLLQPSATTHEHLPDDHEAENAPEIDSSDSLNVHALISYSSLYWSLHSRAASKSKDPPEELRNLLQSIQGSLQRDSPGVSNWTPFHDAIGRGQNEAVEYLIATNFSVDQKDKLGNTPLHAAVQYRNSQAVSLLLEAGAATQMKNNNGNTALHLAASTSDYGIVNLLLREEASRMELNSAGLASIHIAVLHGCMEAIRAFVSASLDIDYKDNFGNSPLHYAALTNQPNIALMLIQAGCAMEPQNEDGNTPLHFATKAAFEDLVALLLRNGAKASTQNNDDQTPMAPEFLIGLPTPITSSLLDVLNTQISASMIIPECVLGVETSGLCTQCANFSVWLSTAAQSRFHGHHTSYTALQQSAAQGCKLCKVISTSILADSGDMPTKKPATGLTVRILLSILRKDSNPQDLLEVRMGSEIVTSLELFGAMEQGAVGDYEGVDILSGRPRAEPPDMENCCSLIQGWIAECKYSARHSQCVTTSASLPRRIINVGQDGTRICLENTSGNQEGDYVFLSYNWGAGNRILTTRANLQSFMQEIPLDNLPQMFLDAVHLVRRLGISYLYIDQLCVVHDDFEDSRREVARLPEYCAGATYTFSAISPDPSVGLFRPRHDDDVLLSLNIISPARQESSGSDCIQIRRPLKTLEENLPETVSFRAWRIQELVLSPRIIFFQRDQVFWNCNTCLRSEGSFAMQQPVLRLGIHATNTPEFDVEQRNHLMPWYSLIELFSQTKLSFLHDALRALASLARNVEYRLHFQYVAGLWLEDLPRGLLWRARTKSCLTRPSGEIAPSWSCVSLVGPVSYSFARTISLLSPRDAPRFDDVGRSPQIDQFGEAYYHFYLSAVTFQISAEVPLGHLEFFFDLVKDEKSFLDGSKKYFCVVIARHYLDITDKGSRYIGLLVKEVDTQINLVKTSRVGIFVGPSIDHPTDEWVRKSISIV